MKQTRSPFFLFLTCFGFTFASSAFGETIWSAKGLARGTTSLPPVVTSDGQTIGASISGQIIVTIVEAHGLTYQTQQELDELIAGLCHPLATDPAVLVAGEYTPPVSCSTPRCHPISGHYATEIPLANAPASVGSVIYVFGNDSGRDRMQDTKTCN